MTGTAPILNATGLLREILRRDHSTPHAEKVDAARDELLFLSTFYARLIDIEERERVRALQAQEDDSATYADMNELMRLCGDAIEREVTAAERLSAPQLTPLVEKCRHLLREIEMSLTPDQEFFAGTPEREAALTRLLANAHAEIDAGLTEPLLPIP